MDGKRSSLRDYWDQHLRPPSTNNLIKNIVKKRLPFDPNFSFNIVHADDVAEGMISAAERGKKGERYLLATEPSISTTQMFDLAREIFPNVKKPKTISKFALIEMALFMEIASKITRQEPQLLMGNVRHYYQADTRIDISKARRELGYNPKKHEEAIKEVMVHFSK